MADITMIATDGRFGEVTNWLVAIATGGRWDKLLMDGILGQTITIKRTAGVMTRTRSDSGVIISKRGGSIGIE